MTLHLRATPCHLPNGITQCYLPPDTSEHTPPEPQLADSNRFTYPGGMEGWVDLGEWVSEQFLNGTSAQYRLCSAILLKLHLGDRLHACISIPYNNIRHVAKTVYREERQ